jgi:hypothetical protein
MPNIIAIELLENPILEIHDEEKHELVKNFHRSIKREFSVKPTAH